jgi:excisionase family DNA binding protein
MQNNGVLTVSETAAALNLSVHTIRAWIATRKIAHVRLGRAIRVPSAEVRRLVDEGLIPAARPVRG